MVASLALAPLRTIVSGIPLASPATCSFDPCLPRSTGWRRSGSPLIARRLNESTLTRPRSTRPAAPSSSSGGAWSCSNTPARAHSSSRRQQVVAEPQPNSLAGSSAHGVEVRAMNTSPAAQLRSGTRRGAPPRGRGGGSVLPAVSAVAAGGERGAAAPHDPRAPAGHPAGATMSCQRDRDLRPAERRRLPFPGGSARYPSERRHPTRLQVPRDRRDPWPHPRGPREATTSCSSATPA